MKKRNIWIIVLSVIAGLVILFFALGYRISYIKSIYAGVTNYRLIIKKKDHGETCKSVHNIDFLFYIDRTVNNGNITHMISNITDPYLVTTHNGVAAISIDVSELTYRVLIPSKFYTDLETQVDEYCDQNSMGKGRKDLHDIRALFVKQFEDFRKGDTSFICYGSPIRMFLIGGTVTGGIFVPFPERMEMTFSGLEAYNLVADFIKGSASKIA